MLETDHDRECLASNVLLPGENREGFLLMLRQLQESLDPRTAIESALVDEIAVSRWCRIRTRLLERIVFTWQMEEQARLRPESAGVAQAALACEQIAANSRCLDMLAGWRMGYHKMFADNMRLLFELRRELRAAAQRQNPESPNAD